MRLTLCNLFFNQSKFANFSSITLGPNKCSGNYQVNSEISSMKLSGDSLSQADLWCHTPTAPVWRSKQPTRTFHDRYVQFFTQVPQNSYPARFSSTSTRNTPGKAYERCLVAVTTARSCLLPPPRRREFPWRGSGGGSAEGRTYNV